MIGLVPNPVSGYPHTVNTRFIRQSSHGDVDEDKAASDWETVAADDGFDHCQDLDAATDHQSGFQVQSVFGHAHPSTVPSQPRPATPGPRVLDRQERAEEAQQAVAESQPLFSKHSSLVNQSDSGSRLGSLLGCDGAQLAPSRKRAVTMILDRNASSELVASGSVASSSLTGDRFRYDCGEYSIFLRAADEAEVGRVVEAGMKRAAGLLAETPHGEAGDAMAVNNTAFYDHDAIRST